MREYKDGFFDRLGYDAKQIFNILQKKGPLTKGDISLAAGLKLTTLNRIMEPLEEVGLVVRSKIGDSSGGRKPVLYDINPNKFYVAGIDISRTYAQVVITNLKMDIISRQRFPMDAQCSPEKTVEQVSQAVLSALEQISGDKVFLGAGVGTVGPLDNTGSTMLNPINFDAPGWTRVPIKEMVEDALKCLTVVDNGANAAVLAETLFGNARGFGNSVYFHCGVGIRTGAFSSGTLIRTINNSEDAFGHMVIDVDGEACSCGNYGCVECYSSIKVITKGFVSKLKKGRTTGIAKPVEEMNYTDICMAAEKNDSLAREVLADSAAVLGTGLANVINLLNPGYVILSGPLIKHSKLFYEVCTDIASKKCYSKRNEKIIFNRGGRFDENAISVGAAAIVVEKLLGSKMIS